MALRAFARARGATLGPRDILVFVLLCCGLSRVTLLGGAAECLVVLGSIGSFGSWRSRQGPMPVTTRSNTYSPEHSKRACMANTFATDAFPPWTAEDAAESLTRTAACSLLPPITAEHAPPIGTDPSNASDAADGFTPVSDLVVT